MNGAPRADEVLWSRVHAIEGGKDAMRPLRIAIPAFLLVAVLAGCAPGVTSLPGAFKPDPQPVSAAEAARALAIAETFIGTPYLAGGRGPTRFDSSGIYTYAYRQVIPTLRFRITEWDATFDATHKQIYYWDLEKESLEDLKPGDLVYLTDGSNIVTHGALFVGWVKPYSIMRFLDASSRRGVVGIQEWPVKGVKHGQWIVGWGRLKVIRGPKN